MTGRGAKGCSVKPAHRVHVIDRRPLMKAEHKGVPVLLGHSQTVLGTGVARRRMCPGLEVGRDRQRVGRQHSADRSRERDNNENRF